MLTFENVLDVFKDYLREDAEREIVRTKHCYAVLLWDAPAHDWSETIPCETPERLFDILLESYQMYHSYLLMGEEGNLTEEIEAVVRQMSVPYQQKRQELEKLPPELTFANVLGVFHEYLAEEDSCEVVTTSHGYAVLDWDAAQNDFEGAQFCSTPEQLRDVLLGRYEEYQEYLLTDHHKRDSTDEDEAEIEKRSNAMLERCQESVQKES